MSGEFSELKVATWSVVGPIPAALTIGLTTNLWVLSWGVQLAASAGYLSGARARAKRRGIRVAPLQG
jgi:hypothetical protein